jgi:hypothetical protein
VLDAPPIRALQRVLFQFPWKGLQGFRRQAEASVQVPVCERSVVQPKVRRVRWDGDRQDFLYERNPLRVSVEVRFVNVYSWKGRQDVVEKRSGTDDQPAQNRQERDQQLSRHCSSLRSSALGMCGGRLELSVQSSILDRFGEVVGVDGVGGF